MQRGIAALFSGMIAEQDKLEVVTNNLANVSTAGFKRQECVCSDFSVFMHNAGLSNSPAAKDALARAAYLANRFQNGTTVMPLTVMEEGSKQQTGNPLDMALEGEGFFSVQTPKGVMYTRNGQFHLDKDGYLVSSAGYQLLSNGGPIQLSQEGEENEPVDLKVDDDGNIFYGRQNAGKLSIANAQDPSQLTRTEQSLFMTVDGTKLPEATDGYQVRQGFVELSNVSVVAEMANMIEVHRVFETYQKIFQQYDQLRSRLIEQAGRGA